MPEFAWTPTPRLIQSSRLQRFINQHGLDSLEGLRRKAIEEPAWFWDAVVKDLGIVWRTPYSQVLDSFQGPAWPRWFVGGRLNIVESCLDRWAASQPGKPALIWEGEEGERRSLTYQDLLGSVCRLANGLSSLGIREGDAVGIYLPMIPETAIALFAIARVGAIAVPLFSGFAAPAIVSRLNDAKAKALITADGFFRRGQVVDTKQIADRVAADVPTLQSTIVVRRAKNSVNWDARRDVDWSRLLGDQTATFPAAIVPADHPLMILYTSGTTGRPKGILHIHTGFPIKAAQDMAHGFDLRSSDILYWVTDIGWMMGPWQLLGAALHGATSFLYDGALDYPKPQRLFELIECHRPSVLGISPTLIRSLMRFGAVVIEGRDLSSLRILGSTGEPWNPESWNWFFKNVGKGKLPIINYSGGTEISGGIVIGNLLTPMKPCSFGGPPPGMAADVVDENAQPVRGKIGELVVRQPWVGQAHGFWNDPQRYLDTYWSRWKDLWVHGDLARIDEDGLWYIEGRSDDTIKVAGKRVGPAEVESALAAHPAILESAAVGIPDPIKGESLVIFSVLRPTVEANDKLKEELKERVAEELGKAMKPAGIIFVRDLPKTRNAKIMRRVVRAVYLGKDPGDLTSLENPAILEEIRKLAAMST